MIRVTFIFSQFGEIYLVCVDFKPSNHITTCAKLSHSLEGFLPHSLDQFLPVAKNQVRQNLLKLMNWNPQWMDPSIHCGFDLTACLSLQLSCFYFGRSSKEQPPILRRQDLPEETARMARNQNNWSRLLGMRSLSLK